MKGKEGQKQFSGFGFAQSRGSAPTLGKLQLHRNETSKHDPERLSNTNSQKRYPAREIYLRRELP
jgi:hypothetical protein